MTRGSDSSMAGGDARGVVGLLVCFVLALGLHAGLVPVFAGGWGQAPVTQDRGPQVQWAPSVAGAVAGQDMPLALLIDEGHAQEQGVEVRVRWSRQEQGDGAGQEVARWEAWSAFEGDADAGAGTLAWGWSVPGDLSGPGWLLAQVRPAGLGAEDGLGWSPVAARTLWIEPGAPPEVGVEQVVAPEVVAAGGVLRVGYTLVNRGPGWVRGPVEDRVELRPVNAPGAEPWTVSTAERRDPIAPGATWDHDAAAVRLPADAVPGDYELVVTPGGPGAVVERRAIEVRAATHADLAVAAFEAPPTVTAGRPFALRFVVENRAPRATGAGLWGDRVYLSVDDVLDAGDVVLKSEPRVAPLAGFDAYASPEHEVTVAVADAVSSVMFLIVSVDDENNLDEGAFEGNNTRARPVTVVQPEDADAEVPELKLGQEDAPADRVAVAWIAYEDFQELQARRSVTHQPAVQARVEPTPDAPLRSDASPDLAGPAQPGVVDAAAAAAPPPRPEALPVVEAEVPTEAAQAQEQAQAQTLDQTDLPVPEALEPVTEPAPASAAAGPATLDPEAVALGGVAPELPQDVLDAAEDSTADPSADPSTDPPVDSPAEAPADAAEPAVAEAAPPPTPPTPPTPPDAPATPADAATTPVPTPEPRPSSTPRSDREADPTAPVAVSVVRPGTVLVGRGLEVRTVRPRFSVTARTLSVPSNPEVVLTFNADGTVRVAELRTSSGFDNIDGPLLSSLYAWTARGPRLAEEPEARVAITILFRAPADPVRGGGRGDSSESETAPESETESQPESQ